MRVRPRPVRLVDVPVVAAAAALLAMIVVARPQSLPAAPAGAAPAVGGAAASAAVCPACGGASACAESGWKFCPHCGAPLGDAEKMRRIRTLRNIRTIATAAESYSIDENRYPAADSIDSLAGLLEPTYIRRLPRTDAWGRPFTYLPSTGPQPGAHPNADGYLVASAGPDGRWHLEPGRLLREIAESRRPGAAPPQLDAAPDVDDLIFADGVFLLPRAPEDEDLGAPRPAWETTDPASENEPGSSQR